mmetsp:Transcript_26223/g.66740  ORF Transcript_26223/g.66740 Transcript_26223/m.66740 type:complete len:260 (-) Transcript_26223:289-1068(-)
MRAMASAWQGVAGFRVVYVAEAHATDEWPIRSARYNGCRGPVCVKQHRTTAERCAAASAFVRDFGWEGVQEAGVMRVLVEPVAPGGGQSEFDRALAPWPIRFYVVEVPASERAAAQAQQGQQPAGQVAAGSNRQGAGSTQGTRNDGPGSGAGTSQPAIKWCSGQGPDASDAGACSSAEEGAPTRSQAPGSKRKRSARTARAASPAAAAAAAGRGEGGAPQGRLLYKAEPHRCEYNIWDVHGFLSDWAAARGLPVPDLEL